MGFQHASARQSPALRGSPPSRLAAVCIRRPNQLLQTRTPINFGLFHRHQGRHCKRPSTESSPTSQGLLIQRVGWLRLLSPPKCSCKTSGRTSWTGTSRFLLPWLADGSSLDGAYRTCPTSHCPAGFTGFTTTCHVPPSRMPVDAQSPLRCICAPKMVKVLLK